MVYTATRMFRLKSNSLVLLFSIVFVLVLSILLAFNGYRSYIYNRLSQEALSILVSWNTLEQTKADLLMNRASLNAQGEFDYRDSIDAWNRQIEEFREQFEAFLKHVSRAIVREPSLSYLKDASIIWDMTYSNLVGTNEVLKRLEKTGLDATLFPELIANYYMYRMGDRIGFEESVSVMNLLNQFSYLDITSKELSTQIRGFISELLLKHESNSRQLIYLSAAILALLIASIVLTFLLLAKFRFADQHLAAYQKEEHQTALRRFIKGHETWGNIEGRLGSEEIRSAVGSVVLPVLMRLDDFGGMLDRIGPTELNRRLSAVSSELERTLRDQAFLCMVISFEDGLLVLNILRGTLLAENEEERTFRLIGAIKGFFPDGAPWAFSFTYGRSHVFPGETQDRFKELYEASFYKLLFGRDTIISAESMSKRGNAAIQYPIQLEKPLTEYIKQGKIDKAKEVYARMMTVLSEANYVAMKNGINRMVVAITSALDSLEKFNNLGNSIDIIEITRRIQAMETIEEINGTIDGLIDRIATELSEKRGNYQYHQVGEIHAIIDGDFANPNLSVDIIAEKLNLSAAHVGRVYRNLTGRSIQEALNQKRLDSARELLLKEKITIAEICDTVGIANPMYFYTQFKKQFGLTPKEYRQRETGKGLASPDLTS
jgi:AraC-like DNA-binding protein